MSEARKLTLSFGALSPRLSEQIESQGLIADPDKLEYFQRDIDALIRCKVRGLISESAVDKAASKLLDRISTSTGITQKATGVANV